LYECASKLASSYIMVRALIATSTMRHAKGSGPLVKGVQLQNNTMHIQLLLHWVG
jgi:hypothetical protein